MELTKLVFLLFIFFELLAPTYVVAQSTQGGSEQPSVLNSNQRNHQSSAFIKQKYGEWNVVCEQVTEVLNIQCVLIQNVIANDRDDVGLSVIVIKTPDKKNRILRILAPLGILLPNGLGLIIDGKDLGRAYFTRCFSDGCFVQVVMDDNMFKAFETGQTAIFFIFQNEEEGIGLPIDLTGFSEGFAALD